MDQEEARESVQWHWETANVALRSNQRDGDTEEIANLNRNERIWQQQSVTVNGWQVEYGKRNNP